MGLPGPRPGPSAFPGSPGGCCTRHAPAPAENPGPAPNTPGLTLARVRLETVGPQRPAQEGPAEQRGHWGPWKGTYLGFHSQSPVMLWYTSPPRVPGPTLPGVTPSQSEAAGSVGWDLGSPGAVSHSCPPSLPSWGSPAQLQAPSAPSATSRPRGLRCGGFLSSSVLQGPGWPPPGM